MVKKLALFFFVIVFFSLVSALPTDVKIKTLPYHSVIVTISKDSSVLERFKGSSDYFGDISFTYSATIQTFDVFVQVDTLAGERVYGPEYYPDQRSGDKLQVDLYPSDYVFPVLPNKTVENLVENASFDSNSTDSNTSDTATITITGEASKEVGNKTNFFTNFAIIDENGEMNPSFKVILYILGVVILLLIIFFLVKRFGKRENYGKISYEDNVQVRKLSEVVAEKKDREENPNKEAILSAERKIQEAQAELNRAKNRDKIEALKKELDRLERG